MHFLVLFFLLMFWYFIHFSNKCFNFLIPLSSIVCQAIQVLEHEEDANQEWKGRNLVFPIFGLILFRNTKCLMKYPQKNPPVSVKSMRTSCSLVSERNYQQCPFLFVYGSYFWDTCKQGPAKVVDIALINQQHMQYTAIEHHLVSSEGFPCVH